MIKDGDNFPEEWLDDGHLSLCKISECDNPLHFAQTNTKLGRKDYRWLQNSLGSDKKQQLVPYAQDTITTYSVNLIADIGNKEPMNFTFQVDAENMTVAYAKAQTFWSNACSHMDTGAHVRMGMYSMIELKMEGKLSDVHFGEFMPTVKYNEPMLITISNNDHIGVEHNNQTETLEEFKGVEIDKDFTEYLKKQAEEE